MTDRIGQRLGNYRLLRSLGRGGFAEVYLGEHIHLGSQAAIKVLQSVFPGDDFLTEARRLVQLKHPHIVRFLEFGVEGDVPFLVMEYAPNGSLRMRHPAGSQIPLETIVSYVKQVAAALQYAHEKKLIHRDVKPENMLLGENHQVLLSDFGIALVAQSTRYQNTEEVAGTATYMAPEQLQGRPRRASDQYALGVVVYEWICGGRPFHGTFTELYSQHMFVPPPSLCEQVPELPFAVEEVVLTALAKDPEQRFAHVQAFATALEQASRRKQFPSLPSSLQGASPSQWLHPLQPSLQTVFLSEPLQWRGETAPPDRAAVSKEVPLPTSEQRARGLASPQHSFQQSGSPVVQLGPELLDRSMTRRMLILGLGLAGIASIGAGTAGAIWWMSQPHVINITQYTGHSKGVWGVAWSPDGKYIASGGYDRTVQVWYAYVGRHIYTYSGHTSSVAKVAWSPDSRRVASASYDNTVQVWDALTGGHLHTYRGHSDWVFAVAWSPDGTRVVSAGLDLWVRVWHADTGKAVSNYKGDPAGIIFSVAWSPDGTHIASAGQDKTVHVWELTTGKNFPTYREHHAPVTQIAWSPDGTRIASASQDKTAQIWNATTGQHIYTYPDHTDELESLTWSPYGTDIASAGGDSVVRVWQIE